MAGSTWTWKGVTGQGADAANWTLTGGPGNGFGYPQAGDTVINPGGTVLTGPDTNFSSIIFAGATAGAVAALFTTGDAGMNFANPTFDSLTVLSGAVPGHTTAETSLLDASGTFVNEGTILANGPAGSSVTIDISGTTVDGTFLPGYFFNPGTIEAGAGNTLIINVGSASELLNSGEIIADGGTVQITAATSAIAGGDAPLRGFEVIEGGGMLETAASVPAADGNNGTHTEYEFADSTPGNTLKIDNVGSFGGAILHFAAGDTIDLGTLLAVGTLVYTTTTNLLSLESAGGTTLATLLLGNVGTGFATGTSPVIGGSADGINIGVGADGDTVLTTNMTLLEASGSSGTWQSAGSWVGGVVPSATDNPDIGLGASAPFTLTTAGAPVAVGGFGIDSPLATVQIASDTTLTSAANTGQLSDFAGTLDITAVNTLVAGAIQLSQPTASFTLAAGATADLAGRINFNAGPTAGVWPLYPGGNPYAFTVSAGTAEIDGALLAGPTMSTRGGSSSIGYDSAGQSATVIVNAGATVTDTHTTLGSTPTSSGTLIIDGVGATWTDFIDNQDTYDTRGNITVGYNDVSLNTPVGLTAPGPIAAAQLFVENGATLTDQGSGASIGYSPDSAGTVTVTNGGVWDLSSGGTNATSGGISVGNAGSGTLLVLNNGTVAIAQRGTYLSNGSTLAFGGILVGLSAGATGTVMVSGAGSELSSLDGMTVGNAGQGSLDVQDGGAMLLENSGIGVGVSAGAAGTVVVSGTGSVMTLGTTSTGVGVGKAGQGTFDVQNGGTVSVLSTGHGISVGQSAGSSGTLEVSGPNSVLTLGTATTGFSVGQTGQGNLEIADGGAVSIQSAGFGMGVGQTAAASGIAVVSGSGALLTLGTATSGITVGQFASGTLEVLSGGTVSLNGTGALDIGLDALSSGSVVVSGAGALLTLGSSVASGVAVGLHGQGFLDVANGGSVSDANRLVIGSNSGSTGSVSVDGGMVTAASVTVGNSGTGTLEIGVAGTVAVTTATVGPHGSIVMAGGLLDPITTTLNAGGVISGFGTLDANLGNNSTVTANSGALEVTGTVSGSGTMDIAAGATLVLPGTVLPSEIVGFTASSGVLQLGTNGAIAFSGTIGNMLQGDIQPGDTIILTGVTDASAANLLAGNTLQVVTTSFGDIDLNLDPEQGFGGDTFHVATVGGNAVVTETPCYLAGTHILTDRGEILVEKLCIGDRVVTLDGSAKRIKWIGRRSYSGAIPAGLRDVIPILIRQGALGENLPTRDLIVSPLHAMYCDDVLVPAEHLVNGITILRAPDIDPIRYFHIELDQHDVIYADGAPAETFVDCDSRSMFHNAAEFDSLYPGDATPRWQYCAPRVEGGERLAAVKRAIDRRAGIALPAPGAPPGRLEGRLDGVEGSRISGWAFHPDRPVEPVWLEVLDGDGVIARVHARRYRADLEEAGIGDGRHGFELHLTGQMRTRREIRVRRVEDGVELDGSPLVIEARGGAALLEDARRVIAAAMLDSSDAAALDALAAELLHGVDALRQAASVRAVVAGTERRILPLPLWEGVGGRGRSVQPPTDPSPHPPPTGGGGVSLPPASPGARTRRALIIDAQLPRPEHDAGSQAILSHAAALAALGFQVEFVAAHELARAEAASVALEEAGYVVHRAPRVASVEEVLRRHRNAFDLVYLHRLANAEAYAPLARAWQARARLLYCVADLHHVRLARQAAVQASAERADEARAVRVRELNAMRLCDAVITHSTAEAAYLARVAPGAQVHVVAWTPGARPRPVPLAARQGVAAIGSWSHEPNVDAVRWLVSDIMPRVWAAAPRIELLVVGSDWPARVAWITDARVRLVGAVTSIETLLGIVRVSVAPLRFGAGLKGKVLDSFAAEVPCVMTPVAAEGFALEGTLPKLVAEDAATLASLIVRLHDETPFHRVAAADGLALAATFSADAVRAAMAAAVGVREAAVQAPEVVGAGVAGVTR